MRIDSPMTTYKKQMRLLAVNRKLPEIEAKTGIKHSTLWRYSQTTCAQLGKLEQLEKHGYLNYPMIDQSKIRSAISKFIGLNPNSETVNQVIKEIFYTEGMPCA